MTAYPSAYLVWRTLGGTDDLASSTARLVRAAIADHRATVAVALLDGHGHLRSVWRDGPDRGSGGERSRRRRRAFETGVVQRASAEGASIDLFPMRWGKTSIGVLEVAAPTDALERARATLEGIAEQLAVTLRSVSARGTGRSDLGLEGAATLGRLLLSAVDAQDLVRIAARYIFEGSRTPVAGWHVVDEGQRYLLSSAHGMGLRSRQMLKGSTGSIPAWDELSEEGREEVLGRFAASAGTDRIEVLGGREVLILVADPTGTLKRALHAVRSLLDEVLRRRAEAARTQQRNEQLDLGVAWIAHELRGPVLGVKAVLENVVQGNGASPETEVLRRSVRELERLAETTEGLLGWAVGSRPLQRRSIDLGGMIDEAVASCILETGNDSIYVAAPLGIVVKADPVPLRAAVVNLVRNAFAFSRPGEKVQVVLERAGGWATIEVRDEGPGVSVAERETIFDPFVRGRASSSRRMGSGLGLFIARRVVEAHGGRIWMESDGHGASFVIRLREAEGVSRRCAS